MDDLNKLQSFTAATDLVGIQQNASLASVEETRVQQEIQAALVVAQKFPRNETKAYARIIDCCKRQAFAKGAIYTYPRGGQQVTGPSIRLAEILGQYWGNVWFGVDEVSSSAGSTTLKAWAWDLENNIKDQRIFTVNHERKAKGRISKLDDPRDIYELGANMGARRKRACILSVLPPHIKEDAIQTCRDAIAGIGDGKNLGDYIRKMILAFKQQGVSPEMLEERLGHKLEDCDRDEYVDLTGIYQSIKDGQAKRGDYFELAKKKDESILLKKGKEK